MPGERNGADNSQNRGLTSPRADGTDSLSLTY